MPIIFWIVAGGIGLYAVNKGAETVATGAASAESSVGSGLETAIVIGAIGATVYFVYPKIKNSL